MLDDDAPRLAAERSAERPAWRAPAAPRAIDPFFDKPYEPSSTDTPAWEAAKPAAPVVRQLSPNIRSKKKTASLLGGGPA